MIRRTSLHKAFIFDFDFTLVDSSRRIKDFLDLELIQMGYSAPSDENIKQVIGCGLPEPIAC